MIIVWLIVLVACLYCLSWFADKFTDAAEKIGAIFKMPHFVIGILIVAVGTSLPELATSIFGVIQGESGILAGNVTGSTIANIFLGLGLVVILSRRIAKFNWDSISNDMPFLIGATVLLFLTIVDGVFKFYEALIFLVGYIIYIIYSIQIQKLSHKEIRDDLNREIKSWQRGKEKKQEKLEDHHIQKPNFIKLIFIFIISLGFIIFFAKFTVTSLIQIATIWGLDTSALAASLVSIGTSLPEISVGVASARKGNFDMVLGNIMGSNIFNILVVFGLVGIFTDVTVPKQVIVFILPIMCCAILIQWLITLDKKITITEGLFMVLLYVAFIGKLFNLL